MIFDVEYDTTTVDPEPLFSVFIKIMLAASEFSYKTTFRRQTVNLT